MTGHRQFPKVHPFIDEDKWLERVSQPVARERPHVCGHCATPYGKSALPCRNDPMYDQLMEEWR